MVTCDRLSTWFSSFPRRQLPRKSLISHCTVHYNSFQIPVSLSSVTKKVIARNNRDEPVCGPKQVRISKESRWRNEEMSVDEMFVGRKKINDWCGTSYLLYTLIYSCFTRALFPHFEMSGCERMRQSFPKWILGSAKLSLINRTTNESFFQPTRIQIFNIFIVDSIHSVNVFYLIPWPTHFSHPVSSYFMSLCSLLFRSLTN